MARIKGTLLHGVMIGKELCKEFELHDHLTAGQLIEAKEGAEKVEIVSVAGRPVPVVVESPARLGALILCQQIASLGPLVGPLELSLIYRLHQEDLDVLDAYADFVGGAITAKQLSEKLSVRGLTASPGVTQRGRGAESRSGADAERGSDDPQGRGD